jgi:hypothetical protein
MVLWALGMIPALIITFRWLLDPSLPWLGWHGYCRAAFWGLLPIAGVSWMLLAIHLRDWRKSRSLPGGVPPISRQKR